MTIDDLRQRVQMRMVEEELTWYDDDSTPNEWKFARGATLAFREVLAMIDGVDGVDLDGDSL